jgi:NAD+ synthetase
MKELDCQVFVRRAGKFIVKEAEKRKRDLEKPQLLVPLSGGVDSSTVAALCSKTDLETKAITITDSLGYTRPQDVEDARIIANRFNLEHQIIDATSIYSTIPQDSHLIKAHTMMGFRRSLLNSIAEKEQRVMIGTGNLSEFYSGLFCYNTLLGQVFPIDDLFKTQVHTLAEYLFPLELINLAKKPSHSGIVGEETDEEKMGMSFEEFDVIAFLLKNKRRSPKSIARELGYEQSFIESIKKCADESKIKMTFPLLKSRSLFKRILSLSL